MDWETITNNGTDKGLISEIYEWLIQLNSNKKRQPNQKMSRRLKQTFFKRRHTDDQQAHEKMLNITNYQRNANQSYTEVSFHTSLWRVHAQSCLTLFDPLDCSPPGLLCPWDSPGKNTGMGCHFLRPSLFQVIHENFHSLSSQLSVRFSTVKMQFFCLYLINDL